MSLALGKHKQPQTRWLALAAVVLIVAGMLSSCTAVGDGSKAGSDRPAARTTEQALTTTLYDEDSIIALYEKAIPAVVMITVEVETTAGFRFNSPQEGLGSGFIIDDQGHIVTNNHVVENAVKITVMLNDDRRLEAEIVGTDRESDVALLRVSQEELGEVRPLVLGDSDSIRPGQMAIALGSPFGLDGSITLGVVSGVGRSLSSASQRPNPKIIQTDAAINPGNSGGPLLNSAGEVVGINTAIETSSSGIGFVVPINTVKSLLPALLEGGEVKNPWLGISGLAINPRLVALLELPASSGIYVITVAADSPAEKAGLIGGGSNDLGQPGRGGDIITAVDGIKVLAVEDLVAHLNDRKPGDRISLSVRRGDDDLAIEVTLGEWPEGL